VGSGFYISFARVDWPFCPR